MKHIPKKFVTFIMLALIVSSCAISQTYWDIRVKSFCKKDGGNVILEKITLSKDRFIKNDGFEKYKSIPIYSERHTKTNHEFYTKTIETVIKDNGSDYSNNVDVRKSVTTTYRKSDNKPMQVSTYYYRRAGDMLLVWMLGAHPSSYGCNDIPEVKKRYEEKFYGIEI